MQDMQKLNQHKEKILSVIKLKGPSLPIHIARAINESSLFASAFLSELKTERKLKISNMKVGSSPLYYLPGQETQLENFTHHLNSREKESFDLLKKEKILNDESLAPVNRVALRSIKDFAIPVRVRVNEEIRLFWKYFLLSDEELKQEIQQKFSPPTKTEEKTSEAKIKQTQVKQSKPKQIQTKEHEFSKNIKEYLSSKDIEILEILLEKKREFAARIRTNDMFGKQELYLRAKDKKSVTDNDLSLALQKAQTEKMPALFISNGELNNKAKEHLTEWKNLIKFEKLR